MKVTDVRAVIAIGLRGQFGLRGRLPWEGNRGREYVADVERFFELTRGHVVIMGQRTFTSVPDFAFKNRDILEIHASDRPEEVLARFPSRVVFIGGGPPVYAAYAPFIRHWDINRLPYNGEADRLVRSRLARRRRPSTLALRFVYRSASGKLLTAVRELLP
jgi:dihydromethanopterin reductase